MLVSKRYSITLWIANTGIDRGCSKAVSPFDYQINRELKCLLNVSAAYTVCCFGTVY